MSGIVKELQNRYRYCEKVASLIEEVFKNAAQLPGREDAHFEVDIDNHYLEQCTIFGTAEILDEDLEMQVTIDVKTNGDYHIDKGRTKREKHTSDTIVRKMDFAKSPAFTATEILMTALNHGSNTFTHHVYDYLFAAAPEPASPAPPPAAPPEAGI